MTTIQIIIGTIILFLGLPLGKYLAKQTKEELSQGRFWFKLIILISFIGAIVSLYYRNDPLLFTFLFIAVVTSRSLKK